MQLQPFTHNYHLPFTEEVIVGFTVDAIAGSMVEVGAVLTCVVFTDCDAECNAAVVNDAAMEDTTFNVRVVT